MELEPDELQEVLPLPMTVITTTNSEGIDNAAPYGCVMPILRPLNLVALASALPRDTLANIRETEEFVINVMGKPGYQESMKCSKDFPKEVNELTEVGLETTSSLEVTPPRIKKAIGWIEARLEREVEGDDYVIVLGEAVSVEVNDEYLEEDEITEDPLVMFSSNFKQLGDSI
ncbi:flavin reductase family protein [Acetohalobium arabaticum]|uniref:Flavin reductase domain protein FMN-binding protein n=1 Tax=Acetohalobium arabaticum (strain ATCC 49924 / DSM 5501 / Z-7288) TaxID=574087 RepID=D9QVR5_ACEAZ|nr:flavin reductase family protein [Acetohalobium arabaticum]ADL12324.1 flavin reductase domain protein FMN-binding protein [Acetohalobium arabaticum DSM 5501]